MNYSVKVGEKIYEVEIEDLNKRPVIARVDGEVFEVVLERRAASQPNQPLAVSPAPQDEKKPPVAVASSTVSAASGSLVSPLPGTVIEVFVKPGEEVESGQVVLIIEAMKMKNSIRSVRNGTIKNVLVSAGQTVAHKQALVEFEA